MQVFLFYTYTRTYYIKNSFTILSPLCPFSFSGYTIGSDYLVIIQNIFFHLFPMIVET